MNILRRIPKFVSSYPWPSGIIVFFLCLSVWHAWILSTALSGRPELVEDRPYEKGIRYQETIELLRTAQRAGMAVKIRTTRPADTMQSEVNVEFEPRKTTRLGKMVEAKILRADTKQFDQTVALTQTGNRFHYSGNANLPLRGIWIAELRFVIDGEPALIKTTFRV